MSHMPSFCRDLTLTEIEETARERDPRAWTPLAFSTSDEQLRKILAIRREASLVAAKRELEGTNNV